MPASSGSRHQEAVASSFPFPHPQRIPTTKRNKNRNRFFMSRVYRVATDSSSKPLHLAAFDHSTRHTLADGESTHFPEEKKSKGRKGDSSGCKSKRSFGHRLPVPRIDGGYGLPLATAFFFGSLRFLFEDFPHDSIGLLLGLRFLRLCVFLLSFFRLSGRFGFIV